MTESTRKKMVFGLLGAAIIYGATAIEWSSPEPTSPSSQTQANPTSMGEADRANPDAMGQTDPGIVLDSTPTKPNNTALLAAIDSILQTPWGDDPFQFESRYSRTEDRVEEAAGWKLSGIVFTPTNPMAVINSRPVKVGDIINDAAIVKIEQNQVTLECRGDRFVIAVNEG